MSGLLSRSALAAELAPAMPSQHLLMHMWELGQMHASSMLSASKTGICRCCGPCVMTSQQLGCKLISKSGEAHARRTHHRQHPRARELASSIGLTGCALWQHKRTRIQVAGLTSLIAAGGNVAVERSKVESVALETQAGAEGCAGLREGRAGGRVAAHLHSDGRHVCVKAAVLKTKFCVPGRPHRPVPAAWAAAPESAALPVLMGPALPAAPRQPPMEQLSALKRSASSSASST